MNYIISLITMDHYLITSIIRLTLALICGGILGMERGRKNRPAGFRTYILVCLGAALVMLTNEYVTDQYGGVDVARMGAQVINGIGFLGAGTIIFTGHNKVKGLTTAAGLWASACIGLAIGIGFYSGAVIGTIIIYITIAVLHKLDNYVMSSTKIIHLYVELESATYFPSLIKCLKSNQMSISDLEINRIGKINDLGPAVLITLHLSKKQQHKDIVEMISISEGILYAEEI